MSQSASSATPELLAGYPVGLVEPVLHLLADGRLGEELQRRYPHRHAVRSDRVLYDYVLTIKNECLRNTPPLSKVVYDNSLQLVRQALGTNTRVSRVQGAKLKAKNEIRIASIFREAPEAFLRMIVVHELAHLRARDHGKEFYQLCRHMEPAYAQLEFDLRVWLVWRDAAAM